MQEHEAKLLARGIKPLINTKNMMMVDEQDDEREDTTDDPIDNNDEELDVGEAAGELAQHIIGTLTTSTQDVIELFQEVVQSVGTVLEDVSHYHRAYQI